MRYVVLAVEVVVVGAIVFAVAALAMGRFDPMSTVRPDSRARPLPDGEIHAGDVDRVRFGLVLRGYRMAEVDEVLRRLATELALRDEELSRRDEELEHLASFVRADGSVGAAAPAPAPGRMGPGANGRDVVRREAAAAVAETSAPEHLATESAEAERSESAPIESERFGPDRPESERLEPERLEPERLDAGPPRDAGA